jgi:methyl-accepting chemotaxis protein
MVSAIRASANATVMATEDGSKAVEASTRQFSDLASSFRRIVEYVGNTAQAAKEIELSTKQQTSAVEQVDAALSEVARTAKETEASSSQTLQTSDELAKASRDLFQLVGREATG